MQLRLRFWCAEDVDENLTCHVRALLVYFLFPMHFVISICFSKFWQLSVNVNVFFKFRRECFFSRI